MESPAPRRWPVIVSAAAAVVGGLLQLPAVAILSTFAAEQHAGFGLFDPSSGADPAWAAARSLVVITGAPGLLIFLAGLVCLTHLLRVRAPLVGTVAGGLVALVGLAAAAAGWSVWAGATDADPFAPTATPLHSRELALLIASLATAWLVGGLVAIALSRRPASPSVHAAE